MRLLVNEHWEVIQDQKDAAIGHENKENSGAMNAQKQFQQTQLTDGDKQFLMQNVFDSLDSVIHITEGENKVIVSSIENIIYNIAQTDFE